MTGMFKELASFLTAPERRFRVLFFLGFLAFLTQFPFSELLGSKGGFPFLVRKEEWSRFFLHAFQALCVSGILWILFIRAAHAFHRTSWGWRKEAFFFFLMAFAFWLYWIPLGFDATDEGRRMAHSWFMYLGLWDMHVDLRMGGHLLKGLWLHILPGPSVLWGRIGYALLKSTMGLFVFLILRRAFPEKRFEAFCFAFVGLLIISIYGGQVINYNNVPVTLMLGAVYVFQLGSDENQHPVSPKAIFFGNALIPLAILSRFPFLILFLIPILWHSIVHLNRRKVQKPALPKIGWNLGGFLTGSLLILLMLFLTDSLGNYWSTIDKKLIEGFFHGADSDLQSHGHDKASLMERYGEDFRMLGNVLLRMLPLFFLLSVLGLFSGRWRWLTTPVLALITYRYMPSIVELEDWYHGILAIPVAIFVLFLISERRTPPAPFLAYWGGVLFFFSFLGSNNGIINILITGGGLLFIAYTLMLLREMSPSVRKKRFDPSPVLASCLLFLPFYVMHIKPHNIYRDGAQEKLTKMMAAPSLFGIFSTPARVEKVDGIMKAANGSITPYEENLLAVNTIPIFYYLTESPYSFAKHWKLKGMSERERREALNSPDGPDHIIMIHKSPRYRDWPNVETRCKKEELPYYDFFVEYLKGDAYKKVYDNDCFTLHTKVK